MDTGHHHHLSQDDGKQSAWHLSDSHTALRSSEDVTGDVHKYSRERLEVSPVTQEAISHNLGPGLLSQLGWAGLSLGLVLLTPAFIGYVGAVRESRLCLILVRRIL